MRHPLIIIILLFVLFGNTAQAQCCSPGSPVTGSANLGIVEKNKFRLIAAYKHSYSSQYYTGDKTSDYSLLKGAGYDYASMILAYGLTDRLTLEAEAGYFIGKYQQYNLSSEYRLNGSGFSSGVLSAKYNIFNNPKTEWEATAGAGFKFPFSREFRAVDNVTLPQDLQASSGAFGLVTHFFVRKGYTCHKLWLILMNRSEINGKNPQDYRFGHSSVSSFVLSKSIYNDLTGIMQFRHEFRKKDSRFDSPMEYSGGHQLFVSPQLNYSLSDWNFGFIFDIPVYRYLNGTQLGNQYAFSIMVMKGF